MNGEQKFYLFIIAVCMICFVYAGFSLLASHRREVQRVERVSKRQDT